MGTIERKKREKKRRRDTIIDAAEKIIFSKGLDQSTMTEIAQEAELSKGTLYLYFKNKNELYMAITKRGSNILNKKLVKIFSGDHTGIELIRLMGGTYLSFVQDNPGYFNAFLHYDSLRNGEELQESKIAQICEGNKQDAMALMVRALQIGIQDGTIKSSYNPKELAVIIWASTRGITMMNHTMRGTDHHFKMMDDMEINTDSMFKNFLNLIGEGMATEKGKNKYD